MSIFKTLKRLNPLTRVFAIFDLMKEVDLVATLIWNFKFFPYSVAKKMPIYLGYNVDIVGYKANKQIGGGIVLNASNLRRGMIKIGITPYPMFPCNGEHTLLRFNGGAHIVFNGDDVRIMKGCSIVLSYGGELTIGKDVLINQRTLIYSNSKVEIGSHTRIGWYVQIYDTPFHYMIDTETGCIRNPCKPVDLGNNVWIANHATITSGAKVPAFTTVASHALVNKDFSESNIPGGVLVGIPAIYKAAHKVRLLNDSVEFAIKSGFKQSENVIDKFNISKFGHSVCPLDPENNLLYRSNE